jgi:hypothetical protein
VTKQQKKKRNHWVPQSYLRYFAADADRRKVWVLKRESDDEPELKPIKKVATSFYLYAPRGPDGRDYSFEDKLASLEQMFGSPFWDLATRDYIDLCDNTARKGISLLLAVMYLRNLSHLKQMHALHQQMVGFLSQFPDLPDEIEIAGKAYEVDKQSWPSYKNADEDDIKRIWLDEVASATWMAEMLMKMRWAILLSEEPVFVTSDNPVVMLHPSLKFRGIKDAETSVIFPLSPTRVLHIDNRMSEPDGQYYPLRGSAGSLNGLLWRHAIDAMYSSRHTDHVCTEIVIEAELHGFR